MLKIKNLTYKYKYAQANVLHNINTQFECGKLYVILGNNGCGKTTLLKCIDNINKTSNSIFVNEKDINLIKPKNRAKLISYCPQHLPQNYLTTYDAVMVGRRPYITFVSSIEDREIVNKSIETFDLGNLRDIPTTMLSGGEFQRACIARTVAQNTPIMMFDEPTNNLDIKHQHILMHQLQKLAHDDNKCIICVLHDINMAITHADTLLFMKNGNIETECLPNQVNETTFKNIYDVEPKIIDIDGYKAVFV